MSQQIRYLSGEEVERADRFEVAFNRIHAQLRKLAPNERDDSFTSLLYKVSDRYSHVRANRENLRQYAKLRNALVHEYFGQDHYIAVPHKQVVAQIEAISEQLARPKNVLTIAARPVVAFQAGTPLSEVLATIERHSFTSYPVYQGTSFVGLITEDGISKWIAAQLRLSPIVDFGPVLIDHTLPFESPHNVVFVSSRTNVLEVEDLFEERLREREKIEAVIITDTGHSEEQALGIITSWDLVKVDAWSS
ncbi:CBS domain-containing protein [Cohnella faecalis]|uniref:CBS domain-containing protein n=1 Tax=Cohnella faecalis TaxID=2315694 RepID=UPI0013148522|nr:CBS domain-containing protein [Cohnella faecalis]